MSRRPLRLRLIVLTMCCFGLLGFTAPVMASPGVTLLSPPMYQDSDGDGIPDDMDPDDDNDGISDGNEGDPNAAPDNSPIPDDDDDGITNDNDPDDNNNAVTDEDEPVPAPVTNEPPPTGGTSGGGNQGGGDQSGQDSGSSSNVVRALPVTGGSSTASSVPSYLTWLCLVCAAITLAAAGVSQRARPATQRV